jgi:PDDEXK-like uncharacterized protein DUF3799
VDAIATLPAEDFGPGAEGVFELAEETYFSHDKAPGISRTMVVELLQMTPAHAHTLMDGSWTKVSTKQMEGGTLFDKALLTPDDFVEGKSHWIVPAGMKLSSKDGIQFKKDHPGLPYLKATSDSAAVVSAEDVKGMIESVMHHSKARYIVENGVKQECAFAKDPDTGLMRKVRTDARVYDNSSRIVLADVKSTFRGGAVREAWIKHCARQAYHIQDSYYSDVYTHLFEKPFFVFIVVERKPPYAVRMFQLNTEGKNWAREKYRRALDSFRKCQETGVWPGYDEEICVVSLPSWELREPEESPEFTTPFVL